MITEARGTLPHIVHHYCPAGLPQAQVVREPGKVTDADVAAAERILRAHDLAIKEQEQLSNRPAADVWEMVSNEFHRDFVSLLMRRDPVRLASALADLFGDPVMYGLGGGSQMRQAAESEEGNRALATICIDRLASFAEALGVLPYENPEQGRYGENIYVPIADLVARVDECLGFAVPAPPIMGFAGVPVSGGLILPKTAEHAYAAYRLKQLGAEAIAEIGAGYGGVAYFACKMGITDYTIFDLPVINTIHSFYLIKSGCSVTLNGETGDGIKILPWWHIRNAHRFDIVLNQDSFPEIDPNFVVEYLQTIRRVSRLFLSINQEAQANSCRPDLYQNWVSQLVDRVGGFERVARFPFWIRRGYVEELYKVTAR